MVRFQGKFYSMVCSSCLLLLLMPPPPASSSSSSCLLLLPPPPPHASSSCLLLMITKSKINYTILTIKPIPCTFQHSQYVSNYNGRECYALSKCSCYFSTAPDEPNFLSIYPIEDGTDFARQTPATNAIDDTFITQEMRLICYNQPIYDDDCVELDEYAGLTLGVNDLLITVLTIVQPMYNQASILVLDNDSESHLSNCSNPQAYTDQLL